MQAQHRIDDHQNPHQRPAFLLWRRRMIEFLTSMRDVWLVMLGVLLGAFLSWIQARYALHEQARLKFRAAFLPELTALLSDEPNPDECATLQLLEASHPRHHAAYVELWASSSAWRRRRLDKRWQRYRHGDRPPELDEPFTYLASSVHEEPAMRQLAVRNIHYLIS